MALTETERQLYDQLVDLLNNYSCPCVGTVHYPCPRCKVSIEQSRELVAELSAPCLEYGKSKVAEDEIYCESCFRRLEEERFFSA